MTSETPPELNLAGALELSPSPERCPVTIPEHLPPLHRRCLRGRSGRRPVRDHQPSDRRSARDGAHGECGRGRSAVKAARTAYETVWRDLPGAERGKYLYRIARRIQEKSRELAVLESMDNGKPIRETRDVDTQLAAQHFFYYAGWADKLHYAVPGGNVKPHRCGRPGDSLELPAADGRVEARAGPRHGQHRGAQAGGDHAADGDGPRPDPPGLRAAAGCGEHRPPGPATGGAMMGHGDVDKVAFTGSTGVGRIIMKRSPARRSERPWSSAARERNIVFADAALDQAVEGIVNGIFFNQGTSAARARACSSKRASQTTSWRSCAPHLGASGRRPPRQEHRCGCHQQQGAAPDHRALHRGRSARRCHLLAVARAGSGRGLLHRPTLLLGVNQTDTVVREEIFGPVLSVLTFRTPAEAIKKANDTEYGLACSVWTDKTAKL